MDDTRRVAVKLAYDGRWFWGYQRQPQERTVEGALLSALADVGAAPSAEDAALRSSSRTDRGVSALGNVASFRTAFDGEAVCPAVNSALEDVWVYSCVDVPDDFNPRWARQRWYRYFLPKRSQDVPLMRGIAARFEGEHDFSGFARKDDRDPVRTIDSVSVSEVGLFITIDFKAESFLWNMVRRIVWMLDAASTGEIDPSCVDPDSESMPHRTGLAPAEFLVLMDVDCGLEFPVDPKARAMIAGDIEQRTLESAVRQQFSMHMLGMLGYGRQGGGRG